MKIGTLNKMLGLAELYTELYIDHDKGFVSVSCGTIDKIPQLHLNAKAFDDLVEQLHPVIGFKDNDVCRPFFIFMGVRIFCLLSEGEAAEREYITESEAKENENNN